MLKDKSTLISWGKFLIGWPLSFISLAFIVKLVIDKSGELNINFASVNLFYLFLGILAFFIYFLMRSFLWWLELSEKGYKVKFRENAYRFSFSELKRYTPGNIWSFLSRAHQFRNLGIDKKTIGISILADIQLVIIGCGIVSLFSIPWLLNSSDQFKSQLQALVPISIIAILIYFLATGLIYAKKYSTSLLYSIKVSLLSNFFLPGFIGKSKVKLILVSVLTYFMFGLGNYFIFSSIFLLGPSLFLTLSSFFVFSLLIGYLSFITPMGLGVREIVVTLGLSQIISPQDAGAVSIFSRIILIVSELLFLFLIFVWEKSHRKT